MLGEVWKQSRVERRLAAIMAADAVGYSRLMDADEVGTFRRLKDHFEDFVAPLVDAFHGRTVNTAGDGFLAEFRSAVDAVSCAIELQRGIVSRNESVAACDRLVFRIGINIGDVIVDGDEIYGNGVNVATRLEALSDAGGICVSSAAIDQIREALSLPFQDRGEQFVKNVARPVRIFALTAAAIAAIPMEGGRQAFGRARAGALPRLSIVVLPFANFSNDSEQGYFADGVTEDLTTDLSRIVGSFVIARNTAYPYKDKVSDVRRVGRELGVRYVLEGSVRRSGRNVRLNAQLIEAETASHIWADRFDGDHQDLVAIQNEVTGRIARALSLELVEADARRALRLQALDPSTFDDIALGRSCFNKPYSPATADAARRHFDAALANDTDALEAKAGLAMTAARDLANAFSREPAADRVIVETMVREVLDADPRHTNAYYARGLLFRAIGRIDDGIDAFETALAIDPNHYLALSGAAFLYYFGGNAEEALTMSDMLFRISPRDPNLAAMHWLRGSANVHMEKSREAVPHLLRARRANDQLWFVHYTLAAAHALTGAMEDARRSLADMQRLKPDYDTIAKVQGDLPYLADPRYLARAASTTERGLQLAGLPLN